MEQDKGKEWYEKSCDPFRSAHWAKYWLEEAGGGLVFVFDPNGDNAFRMGGNSKNANAIWLLNWLEALGRAKATGGRVIQIIVPGGKDNPSGLSKMQEAEALMASMWGVEVVKLDCREVKGCAGMEHFEKMAGWKELMAIGQEAALEVKQAEADATFAEIDTDGDGFITRAEVIVYITKQGGTEEQANGTFDELDTDKDGKLTKEEFRAAF